jgi:diguanylate cyclase (GGDEF)-like protein/PAS domain S-box-containing protein
MACPRTEEELLDRHFVRLRIAGGSGIVAIAPLVAWLSDRSLVDWGALWGVLGASLILMTLLAAIQPQVARRRPERLGVLYVSASVADIATIAAAAAATGGASSPAWPLFALTTLFFAFVYPIRIQLAMLATTAAAWAAALAASPRPEPTGSVILDAAIVVTVFALSSVPAGQLRRAAAAQAAARHEAQALSETLAATEAWWRSLVERAQTPVLVLGEGRRVLFANPAFTELVAEPAEALAGRDFASLVHEEDLERLREGLGRAAAGAAGPAITCRLRRGTPEKPEEEGAPAPEWRDVEVTLGRLDATSSELVANCHDVSARVAAEAELAHRALHDPLTGLPNRTLFADRVQHALARAERSGSGVGVVYVDLDTFKAVNDTLGHAAGDHYLCEVARRFDSVARDADTLARLGGDEFALLVEGADEATTTSVAERMLRTLEEPIELGRHRLVAHASAGVAASRPGLDAEGLVRAADQAMYLAKTTGGGRVERWRPELHQVLLDRLDLSEELRGAAARGELFLEYQPVVGVDDHRLIGVEALVRWNHPTRGCLPPDRFIPLAEDTGLITEVGTWVLREATSTVARWQHAIPGARRLRLSVNVSARQLHDRHFGPLVRSALERSGLEPGDLTLEVTETALLSDTETVATKLAELRAIGVRVSIDDFGTGYSSLSHLQALEVDEVKIDRSFVAALGSGNAVDLVQGIVDLAAHLALDVVAEGVESPEHLATLRHLRCGMAQGFHIDRPMSAEALARRLSGVPGAGSSADADTADAGPADADKPGTPVVVHWPA